MPSVPEHARAAPRTYDELTRARRVRRPRRRPRRADARTATPARRRSSSRGERDWDEHAEDIVDEELKVMKRINCRAAAVEAVITRHGTVVGPVMTRPDRPPRADAATSGGWCGNDIFPEVLRPSSRRTVAGAMGPSGSALALLRGEGYRGFFEVDYLLRCRLRRDLPGGDQPAGVGPLADHARHPGRLLGHAAGSCSTCWSTSTSTTRSTLRTINARWERLAAKTSTS